jgi:arylsulfatase A-like enzyme
MIQEGRMTRNALLVIASLLAAACGAAAQARKPNVVIVMGDDLGYCDTGLYGCRDISTPNIDSIARAGVLFTSGYVTAPVCSPSRAGLLTGRYQQRFGFEFNAGPLDRSIAEQLGLPPGEITLPQALKAAGYATGMVGKWHLGMQAQFHPNQRGFDEFFGFLFGANLYIDPSAPGVMMIKDAEGGRMTARPPQNPIFRNRTPVEEPEYLTEAFAREAVAFIDRHAAEPFFLYVPFNAPHAPLEATKKYLDRFPGVEDPRRRVYSAMVSALDDAVGAILERLRARGLERDTLLVFLSDNGCATYTRACTNDPLRLGKLTHLEGGFRVPFAMRWPGHIPAGSRYDEAVSSLDLFPTALAATGAAAPKGVKLDGVDLLPYVTGKKKTSPHEFLFWRNGPNDAVRSGRWKLYRPDGRLFLFDLGADLSERANVAAAHPEIVKRLAGALDRWEAELRAPLWSCRTAEMDFEVDGVKLKICF